MSKGGDWFVDAAEWIAEITGIPHIIIGATIVSLATTLPELFVSAQASLAGIPDMAIGNAVGSTICNIGLASSVVIFFEPSSVNRNTFVKKGSILVLSILTFVIISSDMFVTNLEAMILYFILAGYIFINIKVAQASNVDETIEIDTSKEAKIKNIIKFIVGSALIVIGARLLVNNGVIIARFFNVSEGIIGLTLIALGTSLPEFVTAISSVIKKKHHIGLGNIIGANILNYVLILSTSTVLSPNGLVIKKVDFDFFGKVFSNFPQTYLLDVPFSLVMSLLLLLPGIIKGKTYKLQGVTIVLFYGFYLFILFNIAT